MLGARPRHRRHSPSLVQRFSARLLTFLLLAISQSSSPRLVIRHIFFDWMATDIVQRLNKPGLNKRTYWAYTHTSQGTIPQYNLLASNSFLSSSHNITPESSLRRLFDRRNRMNYSPRLSLFLFASMIAAANAMCYICDSSDR